MKKKKICLLIGVLAVLVVAIGIYIFEDIQERINDIQTYEEILGKSGKYKENLIRYNDIFPDSLKAVQNVEEFTYVYYNLWDPNYFGYLVCGYSSEQFEEEVVRLKKLNSTEYKGIYGIEEFPYELCAVYADSYYGVIYAIADSSEHKIVYVDLEFCNYFTDIQYEQELNKSYLPKGFNAKPRNETRKAFEQKK